MCAFRGNTSTGKAARVEANALFHNIFSFNTAGFHVNVSNTNAEKLDRSDACDNVDRRGATGTSCRHIFYILPSVYYFGE